MDNNHYKECLRALLEGLEAQEIDIFLEKASVDLCRVFAAEITKRTKTILFQKELLEKAVFFNENPSS